VLDPVAAGREAEASAAPGIGMRNADRNRHPLAFEQRVHGNAHEYRADPIREREVTPGAP